MASTRQFYGTHTALVTPFHEGQLSIPCLEKLVDYQISNGIQGLIAIGTTAESPTLSSDDTAQITECILKTTHKRVPVLVGTGSNNTQEAIKKTKKADKLGADGLLVVAPYYNKPSQEGLFQHLSQIAQNTEKPIMLYSIPSRCGIEFGVDTILRLREQHPHIIGVKEAGVSCERVSMIKNALDEDFLILSGNDSLTLPFMSVGAHGIVSVASNLIVSQVVEMVKKALNNNFKEATQLHSRYYDFFTNIFAEPNPAPIKYALNKLGLIKSPEVRLPLSQLTPKTMRLIDETLEKLNLKGD